KTTIHNLDHFHVFSSVKCHLTIGTHSEKCIIREFYYHANIIVIQSSWITFKHICIHHWHLSSTLLLFST
uniref:Uncharacterized protein n=1 Tax=Marmota marmota marmota TaxID=9994 RepID=A0A8C6ESH4_MARMA